jgi:hypothetical protein
MSKTKSKSTKKEDKVTNEKVTNVSKPEGKVIVNRGAIMSAVEYAVTYNKSIPIAKTLPLINAKYKEDHYKDEWDFVFKAIMTKPANTDLNEHMKNIKGRNK